MAVSGRKQTSLTLHAAIPRKQTAAPDGLRENDDDYFSDVK
jgi:hypothetical protein